MAKTAIDWKRAQERLHVNPDGNPGPITYTALFSRLGPFASAAICSALGTAAARWFPVFGISDTVERLADMLAQGGHETGGFVTFEENLYYSAERIHAVWPSRFPTVASAKPYAGDPKALGNKVYGDRMSNQLNGLNDDDGWNSRGMGLLMMTGLANRRAAQMRLGLDLVTYPDLAADPATSLEIAAYFYRFEGVLAAIDDGDLLGARKIVNIGDRRAKAMPIGWEDVQARRKAAMVLLA